MIAAVRHRLFTPSYSLTRFSTMASRKLLLIGRHEPSAEFAAEMATRPFDFIHWSAYAANVQGDPPPPFDTLEALMKANPDTTHVFIGGGLSQENREAATDMAQRVLGTGIKLALRPMVPGEREAWMELVKSGDEAAIAAGVAAGQGPKGIMKFINELMTD